MAQLSLDGLDSLSLSHLLSFLDSSSLLALAWTSSSLRAAVSSSSGVWRTRNWVEFGVEDRTFERFVNECRTLGRYGPCLGSIRRSVAVINSAFESAGLPPPFGEGMSEEAVARAEESGGVAVPRELRAQWRCAAGKTRRVGSTGQCLGWFSFYDVMAGLVPSHCPRMEDGEYVAATVVGTERSEIVVLADGRVAWLDFEMAPSWSHYLASLASKLESGALVVHPVQGMRLFPVKDIPTSVSNGIGVSCSPLFIPTQSSHVSGEFCFSYSIRIFGPPEMTFRAKLQSREWRINKGDGGPLEVVRGEGVIGQFPEVEAGSTFSYESVCGTSGPGWMEGKFFFSVQGRPGEVLSVDVPRFLLIPPPSVSRKEL